MRSLLSAGMVVALTLPASAQQVPDRSFAPSITSPEYPTGKGPVVCLDEGHFNFHTLEGRFWAFGELLRRDGYVVRSFTGTFESAALAQCRVLVIANAQPSSGPWDNYPYPTPSAFTDVEVMAARQWVGGGGSLLLIADHMPLAGAAAKLAAAFGVEFLDGFAVEGFIADSGRDASFDKPTIFRTQDRSLVPHPIVRGRNAADSVPSIRTFTGQAFRAPGAEPVLVLPSTFIALMPERAWQFGPETRRVPVGGWLQGAVMRVGSGRAAFFGEAAMFSAQVAGAERRPMGMNAPGAEHNFRFVLNLLHWLSGTL